MVNSCSSGINKLNKLRIKNPELFKDSIKTEIVIKRDTILKETKEIKNDTIFITKKYYVTKDSIIRKYEKTFIPTDTCIKSNSQIRIENRHETRQKKDSLRYDYKKEKIYNKSFTDSLNIFWIIVAFISGFIICYKIKK